MSYISAFDPSEDKKRNLASKIYDISESVTKFFWDDAPRLGIQQREGQQDMAFDVLDAIKSGSHVVIEAGVGIGKSFAYLVPILLYNAKTFSPVVIATSTIALQEQLLSDMELLKKAIYQAYDRCEAMRLRFAQDKQGTWYQYVADKEERDIEYVDFYYFGLTFQLLCKTILLLY